MNMVPTSIVDALAKNDILQILVFSILFGVALSHIGPRAKPVIAVLDSFIDGIFAVVGMIMRLAPIAAFGAMSFTVGKYGLGSIVSLGKLMERCTSPASCSSRWCWGSSRGCRAQPVKFLKYIKDEIFTRARHEFIGVGRTAADEKARIRGSLQVPSWDWSCHRASPSIGRPVHLLHDGCDLHCAGHQHRR